MKVKFKMDPGITGEATARQMETVSTAGWLMHSVLTGCKGR